LLAQSYRNIEIVVVDDCSKDDTVSILKEYAQRDPRFRIIENTQNLGYRRNFEYAMSLCRGEFIAPCDQDDVWLPEKLRSVHAVIGAHPLAYCDSEFVDADGQSLSSSLSDIFRMQSTDDLVVFVANNCVPGHGMLFRRELMEGAFPVPDCFFHDWWLAAIATTRGGIVFCDQKLVKYRQHGATVTDILGARKPTKPKRSPGYRWNDLRNFGTRLQYLAGLPGQHQPFLQKFSALWSAREQQWFSPELAVFMYRHGARVHSLQRSARRFSLSRVIKFSFGLRLKRTLNPYAYTPL
jgi:glycosyltransferase involved in cell wall biosynthesis